MSVRTNSNYEDTSEEEGIELVLVALTYTGSRSTYYSESMRRQGGYPALDGFQRGRAKLAKVPSNKLGWWENHADFEVAYEPEVVAGVLLEANYLPSQLVGPNYDPGVRNMLLEKLDIDVSADEEGYREQLRDIAGVDEEDDENAPDANAAEQTRADELQEDYDRSTLITVADSFDGIDEALDEWGVDQITHAKNTQLASFIASQDNEQANRRLDTASSGGDLE